MFELTFILTSFFLFAWVFNTFGFFFFFVTKQLFVASFKGKVANLTKKVDLWVFGDDTKEQKVLLVLLAFDTCSVETLVDT